MNDIDMLLEQAVGAFRPPIGLKNKIKSRILHSSSVEVLFISSNFGEICDKVFNKNAEIQKKFKK